MKKYILTLVLFFSYLAHSANEESVPAVEVSNSSSIEAQTTPPSAVQGSVQTKQDEVQANNKDETQIPLKISTEKKEITESTSLSQVMLAASIVITLLMGGFFFIKKYSVRNRMNTQHQIKVLSVHHLGPKKSLSIIRVAGESILIGVTDHNISMIKSLSLLDEDLPQDMPQKFDQAMFQVEKKNDDEFTIRGIQDHVKSKLKDMKGIS